MAQGLQSMEPAPPLPPPVDGSDSEDAFSDEPLPPDILSEAEERPAKRRAARQQLVGPKVRKTPGSSVQRAAKTSAPQAAAGSVLRQARVPEHGDAIMEVFCPPRLVPAAAARGLSAKYSLDKEGSPVWDADSETDRRIAHAYVDQRMPYLLLLSPECRMYSILQRNCNLAKMDPAAVQQQQEQADRHIEFCCQLMRKQADGQRYFVMEQPAGASSWNLPCVQAMRRSLPNVALITFPQCRFGLRDPQGRPLQKHTGFLTNLHTIVERFAGLKCICALRGEEHGRIEGTVDGHKVSRWAQAYPDKLVQGLVSCVEEGLRGD